MSAPDRQMLRRQLTRLGLGAGDAVMVHASLRQLGPLVGGPQALLDAILATIGTKGTLLAYVSWLHSPYEASLRPKRLSTREKRRWPAFTPDAPPYPGFGAFNRFIIRHPDMRRSAHPDASMAAIGARARQLVARHRPGDPYGPGSPLEKFLELEGRILMVGAPPDAFTILHYAESVAQMPKKRFVTYDLPWPDKRGGAEWVIAHEPDTNGILDAYAGPGSDAIEDMARDYLALGRHATGRLGGADWQLVDGRDLVSFGVRWLEDRHAR